MHFHEPLAFHMFFPSFPFFVTMAAEDLVGADTTPALLTMSELSKATGAIASGIATQSAPNGCGDLTPKKDGMA